MANKTVSNLKEVTTVSNSDVLLVETSTETLKVTKGNLLKEVNEELNAKSDANHTHDEYVTESELNSKGLATEMFVTNKIAEAQLGNDGGNMDLSGYATTEYVDQEVGKTNAQLSQKINRGEGGAITNVMLSQEVKESMTGGSVAVVGKDTVLTENIVDGQVTRRKTNFYELDWDGNLVADYNIYYYGYLYNGQNGNKIFGDFPTLKLNKSDIDFSTTSIKFNMTSHITFWTENDEFISGYIQAPVSPAMPQLLRNIPQNAKKVRMLIFKSAVEEAVFALTSCFTNELKTSFYIPNLIVESENINNTQNKNPLYGKKFVFFGDSWCAGNTSRAGGWCNWIQEQNPSITVKNCGRHGADWFQCYDYWFRNETNYNSLSDDYDYIIIEAYTNGLYGDTSSLSKQLGAIDEFTYYSSIEEIDNALGNTYARDLEKCLFIISQKWHGKKIGLMFPYKAVAHLRENNAFRQFKSEVVKCANKYNIPVFDNFDGCNIPTWHEELRKQYYFENDGVHLNAKGYDVICPPIENWIKSL